MAGLAQMKTSEQASSIFKEKVIILFQVSSAHHHMQAVSFGAMYKNSPKSLHIISYRCFYAVITYFSPGVKRCA